MHFDKFSFRSLRIEGSIQSTFSRRSPMKNLALCLCCLCLLGTSVPPLTAQSTSTPYPPALRHIEKHPPVIEMPAPQPPQQMDLVQLRHDAEELARLSQSVPVDMERVAAGLLPK